MLPGLICAHVINMILLVGFAIVTILTVCSFEKIMWIIQQVKPLSDAYTRLNNTVSILFILWLICAIVTGLHQIILKKTIIFYLNFAFFILPSALNWYFTTVMDSLYKLMKSSEKSASIKSGFFKA